MSSVTEDEIQAAIARHRARNLERGRVLSSKGVELTEKRPVDVHFWADDQHDATLLARELFRKGFLVKLLCPSEDSGDGRWNVEAGPHARWYGESPMADVGLLVLDRTAWERAAEDPAAFAVEQTLTLGVEPDLLRTVGRQTVAMLERTGATNPWTGYLGVDRAHQIIIGTCAFTAPPDPEGVVEIAYFTFPPFEGLGYGSAMAAGLVEIAEAAAGIRWVRAHTMPEGNASTRILEKLGFERIGETIDPDAGLVWRWDRQAAAIVIPRRGMT